LVAIPKLVPDNGAIGTARWVIVLVIYERVAGYSESIHLAA